MLAGANLALVNRERPVEPVDALVRHRVHRVRLIRVAVTQFLSEAFDFELRGLRMFAVAEDSLVEPGEVRLIHEVLGVSRRAARPSGPAGTS